MASDNAAVAVAAAKRVVKRTKVVEHKVVEVSLAGSKEEPMEVAEEPSRVTRTVPIIEAKEAEDQAQQEQEVVQNQAQEEHQEEKVDQSQAPQMEAKSMEAQDQAQAEQEEAVAAHQQEEMVKISEGAQTQAQEEPEKEKNMEAQGEPDEEKHGQETAQDSKLDKIATPPRDQPKKRVREDEDAQDEAQESIPTPPREEGEAQPKKRPGNALEKKEGGGRRKRKRSKKVEEEPGQQDYRRYIRGVMKTIEPDMRISSRAITVINSFLNDVFEKLVEEAAKLSIQTGKKTLTSKEIQGAVWFVLPGELAKHALAEGNKAWENYLRFKRK